ncbi:MAG: DUF2807 domain-containing protein [Anaerolineales bacterium]|nr:DUF2807 domain-containing protein [Anaerolineales bacterium]
MSRKIFVYSLVIFCFILSGCSPSVNEQPPVQDNSDIKDFESVTMNTPGVMEIYQGTNESLEISGDPAITSSIAAKVIDRILTISSEIDLPTNSSITYKLFVKDLSSVVLNGSGVIKIPAYTSDNLELTINGSSRMDLGDIKVSNLKFIINDSGSIAADSVNSNSVSIISKNAGAVIIESGQTADLMVELGSGTFLGADFKSTNANIDLIGSGSVQVWTVEKMDVTIDGSGNVTYFGEPTLSISINGGGQLTGGGNK